MGTQKQPVVWAGSWLAGSCCAVEAASLPGSSPLVLKRSEAEQGEPVRMAFAGHQFPRALADALGKPAAHEAPMVQGLPGDWGCGRRGGSFASDLGSEVSA